MMGAYAAILGGAAVTFFWRLMGLMLAGRLKPDQPVVLWVACVAFSLLAGLISRMIVLPLGPLGDTPLTARLAGVAIALAAFFLARRSIVLGVLAGAGALVGIAAALA
jgi:branched-subunit amino acid transport protein